MSALSRIRLFRPMMAGATVRERLIACIGACIAVGMTSLLSRAIVGEDLWRPLIVGPIGASAVLVFAASASPLAQPWPVLGGTLLSALTGYGVASLCAPWHWGGAIAVAAAPAAAILVMSLFRCLHPPGGAMALIMALGGPAIANAGLGFILAPVALNAVLLLACAWTFHRVAGRSWPHRPAAAPPGAHKSEDPPAAMRGGFTAADVDAALARVNQTYDIAPADLLRLLREVDVNAVSRTHPDVRIRDLMSRDLISTSPGASLSSARDLLLSHNVRALPVLDEDGRPLGMIGLRDIALHGEAEALVREAMSPPLTAPDADPALSLLPDLTDGRAHAVIVLDNMGHAVGLMTQTDLLWAAARLAAQAPTG